jgi:hypothetical protein
MYAIPSRKYGLRVPSGTMIMIRCFPRLFDDADIRCDIRFYPGRDLLGQFAEGMISGVYADNRPCVGPAERDDAAMLVEEPADGFKRGLDEGEGFLYRTFQMNSLTV